MTIRSLIKAEPNAGRILMSNAKLSGADPALDTHKPNQGRTRLTVYVMEQIALAYRSAWYLGKILPLGWLVFPPSGGLLLAKGVSTK
jgi:hypothetical protein